MTTAKTPKLQDAEFQRPPKRGRPTPVSESPTSTDTQAGGAFDAERGNVAVFTGQAPPGDTRQPQHRRMDSAPRRTTASG